MYLSSSMYVSFEFVENVILSDGPVWHNPYDNNSFLQITEDDLLPSKICYQCASTLISWHELYYICKDVDLRMKEIRERCMEKEKIPVFTVSNIQYSEK